jgi:outer membrane biosynthesis protein TonB
MRRALALSALFGTVVAGLGCTHIGGKNDCTHNPADAILPVPNNPYFPTAVFPHGPVPPAQPTQSETGIQKIKKDDPKADPAPKADPTPETKPEPAPKADPAPKPESKPAPKPEPKPEPMAPASIPPVKIDAVSPIPVLPVIPALAPGF